MILKFCGITNAVDAKAAIEAGATWLGLIFVPNTPRCVQATELEEIATVARKSHTPLVGVFKNQPSKLINELAQRIPLHYVQLHGEEPPEDCEAITRPVIKVFSLSAPPSTETLKTYQPVIDYALYDWPKGLSKDEADWAILPDTLLKQSPIPTLLAGKLTAETVGAVVTRFQPAGIDVAGGIEVSPRQKDTGKMQAFYQAVQVAVKVNSH